MLSLLNESFIKNSLLYSQLPLYRSRWDLYFSFDMTEFSYKGSNISAMKALGERIHLDISGHFVITEFDIEGVYCIYLQLKPV